MILEIAAFSLPDAIASANAGANKIEICSNYTQGVITFFFLCRVKFV